MTENKIILTNRFNVIIKKFALDNNTINVGDIIEDALGKGKVIEIIPSPFTTADDYPTCNYNCQTIRSDGSDNKQQGRRLFRSNHILTVEKTKYAFKNEGGYKEYKSYKDIIKNSISANDDGGCPKCSHQEYEIIGISPMLTTFEKYPDRDVDMGYVWEEKVICESCGQSFIIHNGT